MKNNSGNTVTAGSGANNPVGLESGPAGHTSISEDWMLTVP
ncbi:hypothetical protein [Trebonia kvetii]|nr:hypothetical protein [Trebonia kvetii]